MFIMLVLKFFEETIVMLFRFLPTTNNGMKNSACRNPQKIKAMTANIEHDYSEGKYSWNAIAQGIIKVYTKKLSTSDNRNY